MNNNALHRIRIIINHIPFYHLACTGINFGRSILIKPSYTIWWESRTIFVKPSLNKFIIDEIWCLILITPVQLNLTFLYVELMIRHPSWITYVQIKNQSYKFPFLYEMTIEIRYLGTNQSIWVIWNIK